MKLGSLLVRRIHRYLMTFLAIQVLLWVTSGMYMVLLDINYIRGNHLIKTNTIEINETQKLFPIPSIYNRFPQAKNIELKPLADQLIYQFSTPRGVQLLNAYSGESLLPISQNVAISLALKSYSGSAAINHIRYIDKVAPDELSSRHLPVWQVSFNNLKNDTLYVSAKTGQVVTKRHLWWRVFDIFWMLHIMDYEERSDVSNLLLRCFSITFLLAIFTGIALLVTRIKLKEFAFWGNR